MIYNWQLPDWPEFKYKDTKLSPHFNINIGELSGMLEFAEDGEKANKLVEFMVMEAIKTSAIEGEFLSRKDVMSSVKKNLGIHSNQPEHHKDTGAKGIAYLVVDIHECFQVPLSASMLFKWHKQLFQHTKKMKTGQWRTHESPMQVVSGSIGKETIHFEAPPSSRVANKMKEFIIWFNQTAPGKKKEIENPIVRAALAHLYFESIHPFEDGNGRIGRVLAEKALYQGVGKPLLFSLSTAIESNKNAYYDALKQAQRTLDTNKWITYFTETVLKAQNLAKESIAFSLKKTRFFDRFKNLLNERMLKAIHKMLDADPKGFEGGMTAKKYSNITKISKATATRDLQYLKEKGVFIAEGGGRSVKYHISM